MSFLLFGLDETEVYDLFPLGRPHRPEIETIFFFFSSTLCRRLIRAYLSKTMIVRILSFPFLSPWIGKLFAPTTRRPGKALFPPPSMYKPGIRTTKSPFFSSAPTPLGVKAFFLIWRRPPINPPLFLPSGAIISFPHRCCCFSSRLQRIDELFFPDISPLRLFSLASCSRQSKGGCLRFASDCVINLLLLLSVSL